VHQQVSFGFIVLILAQSGPSYFVEVDIVMNPDASLRVTHDVSQRLQDAIEELPDVERAFVHVDYETSHLPVRDPIPSLSD
jgi:divalent metal cation (Fe/Co/Zn/Cd) transporter